MELTSGWNLPPGLMFIPEPPERMFKPDCPRCHGEGEYEYDTQLEESGSLVAVRNECDCWEDYNSEDHDPRHEYIPEDRQ